MMLDRLKLADEQKWELKMMYLFAEWDIHNIYNINSNINSNNNNNTVRSAQFPIRPYP